MIHIGVVQGVDPRKCIRTSYQRLPTKQTVQSLVKSFTEYGYQPETDGSQRISARRPRLGELRYALVRGDGLSEAAAMQLAQEKSKDAEKDGVLCRGRRMDEGRSCQDPVRPGQSLFTGG